MKSVKIGSFLILLLFSCKWSWGQEIDRKWRLYGYIKDFRTYIPQDGLDNLVIDNLLHNRLNFRWYPNSHWTFALEARNRVAYGEVVKSFPNYADLMDQNNDILDLSVVPINERSLVMHNMLDRAYIEWNYQKWNIRLGRQRINWGINLVWNPNDWFNTYSFFDFDYEERPGSDALRIQRYTGTASRVELAVKAFEKPEEMVAAGLWKFNQWNYDFQLLSGVFHKDAAIGGGWAGHIGSAGFKGEGSYFHPYEQPMDTTGVFATSITVDYMFRNGFYLNGSVLYNSKASERVNLAQFASIELSPKNLFPYKLALFTQGQYAFHPLVSGGIAGIYSPTDHTLFFFPTLTVSLKANWELSAMSQLFFSEVNNKYQNLGKFFFTRLKWSF